MNSADTVENAHNANLTNGSPITLLIPNLDRHFIHIKQYQDTNRTPRPGHASYASFVKYGAADDSIGAGIFSGRYTSTIVGAGYMAKKILKAFGIKVFSYIKEAAGIPCPKMDAKAIFEYTEKHKKMRHDADPFYQELFVKGRLKTDMRFLHKMAVLAEVENQIEEIRAKAPKLTGKDILDQYGVHHVLNCPDVQAAEEMLVTCNKITKTADSSGACPPGRTSSSAWLSSPPRQSTKNSTRLTSTPWKTRNSKPSPGATRPSSDASGHWPKTIPRWSSSTTCWHTWATNA
jgi:chorismate synthase